CKDLCDGQGFDYYATQFGRECWCGSGTPAETYNLYGQLTDVGCDMACTGDASEKCGGILKASVYAFDNDEAVDPVEPVDDYLGCFQDDRDTRILPEMQPISLDSMGATFCKDLCDGQGFDYYATQFGRECWCGS
ncbi:unnamed protein product, partial [Hapterophycus canaliculatus]